jgi:hypothetical protein
MRQQKGEVGLCPLCLQNKELKEDGHLVPKFVGRWLKDTSATGRLRNAVDARVPRQDLMKKPFLCEDCEDRFQKLETLFSNKVFRPYIRDELDLEGLKTGTLQPIKYGEWLLQFAMSLQWRCLAWGHISNEGLSPDQVADLKVFAEEARKYLLGSGNQPSRCETHMLFLQSVRAIDETLPDEVDERADIYLLRSVDPTIVWTANDLGVFVKLGVVVVYTSLSPVPMPAMLGTAIGEEGELVFRQEFGPFMSRFLLIDRPEQAFRYYHVPPAQERMIEERVRSNIEAARTSLSYAASRGRDHVRMLKARRKKGGG